MYGSLGPPGRVAAGSRLLSALGLTAFSPSSPTALDAGQVGLALSYSLTLMGMFQWSVRQSAEVENMVMFI